MNKPTAKEKRAMLIFRHGETLNTIFQVGLEPIKLCKKLRRYEIKAHKLAEDYCNGVIEEAVYDLESDIILDKVNNLLNFRKAKIPVYVNGDPRGYALKIDEKWMRNNRKYGLYADWGGYGLIAPKF